MHYLLDALTLELYVTSLIALRNESSTLIEASFSELALFCVSCWGWNTLAGIVHVPAIW